MKAHLLNPKRALTAGVLAAMTVALAASGIQSTSAAYRDNSYANTASTEASVPMAMFAGRQAKLVDSSISIGADKKAYVWGRTGAGGDAGAALTGVATSQYWEGANGYPRKVQIPGDPDLIDVAADRRTAIAIADGGQLYAWGAGSFLVPGSTSQYNGSIGYDTQPVSKADGTLFNDATMIAAAERNAAIVVDSNNEIWRMGRPLEGGVDGYLPQPSTLPANESGIPISVTGGRSSLYAVMDNGNVYAWGTTTQSVGLNYYYELPGNQRISPADGTTLVEGLQPWNKKNSPNAYVVQVGFGGYDYGYGVALLSDNTLLSWGQRAMVAGHENPTEPQIVASDVAVLAPNFYGVSYLKAPANPASSGYDLYGYGNRNYALGDGTGKHVLVDTNVSSLQPGMGYNIWMKTDDAGEFVGIYGRGYNPQGAVGLNSTGGGPQPGEATIREILFPNKPITSLNFLAR